MLHSTPTYRTRDPRHNDLRAHDNDERLPEWDEFQELTTDYEAEPESSAGKESVLQELEIARAWRILVLDHLLGLV